MALDFPGDTTTYYVDCELLGVIPAPSASDVLLRGALVVYALPDDGSVRADYTARFDNFAITAVPETSALIIWSLLGALGMTFGWWRRRKAA